MTVILPEYGDRGAQVSTLQRRLAESGYDPGPIDGIYGRRTDGAYRAFVAVWGRGELLTPPRLDWALRWAQWHQAPPTFFVLEMACAAFPECAVGHFEAHLPPVLAALSAETLGDPQMVRMALATIRAESAAFKPIAEHVSSWNTDPEAPPFNRYDRRTDLGNTGPPDGSTYRGRGYVQLTGRYNYRRLGGLLGIALLDDPERANDVQVAARILAAFLKQREGRIRQALDAQDLTRARRLVNGGSHGIERFVQAWAATGAVRS